MSGSYYQVSAAQVGRLMNVLAPRVFLRVLRFSSLHKNQHFQIPIWSGIPRAAGLSVARLLSVTLVSQIKVDFFYFFLQF